MNSPTPMHGAAERIFFVEGIHCISCVARIEEAFSSKDPKHLVQVDLGRSTVRVPALAGLSKNAVVESLGKIGFHAVEVPALHEGIQLQEKENRSLLLRTAVAGFCAGNIMVFNFALYAGASGTFGNWFNTFSMLLAVPVLTYSAAPLFQSAWKSIRSRSITIDLPIVLALTMGLIATGVQWVRGSGETYLDSVTSFVFLILASRMVVGRLRLQALSVSTGLGVLLPDTVLLCEANGKRKSIPLQDARVGDILCVKVGDKIPTDGVVTLGAGAADHSFLTGESRPVALKKGEATYAGAKLVSGSIEFRVTAIADKTRMGSLLQGVESAMAQRGPLLHWTSKMAGRFVAAVILIALFASVYFYWADLTGGFDRILSFLIIMCPCALALGIPLVYLTAYAKALRHGILILDGESIDRAAQIERVYFDKTGTLTVGKFSVLSWDEEPVLSQGDLQVIASLEKQSIHPAGIAILEYLKQRGVLPNVDDLQLSHHKDGYIEGIVDGDRWIFEGDSQSKREAIEAPITEIQIKKNGQTKVRVRMGDAIQSGALSVIRWFDHQGISVSMLSGDTEAACLQVASQLGISDSRVYSRSTAESKLKHIQKDKRSLVVGDGMNDLLALSAADLAIAVRGGIDACKDSAQVFLENGKIEGVRIFLEIAAGARKVLRRNWVFTIAYNTVGGTLALTGHASPFVAAILMPLSALTVFLSSTWGFRWKS